ncbi:helix-turn-helix domain-containing protein [Rhizobium straminoryzae]|uniref:Helix-turn-helix domain-containing protein n=1 Tax=Rhizobium straminoryzae TaxID=1387186 RepID=A0A549T0X4_9HYPH|nr:helix-turn-helix domain-containing protein [Rhizobium straminoryzae]
MCVMHFFLMADPVDIKSLREKLGWDQGRMARFLAIARSSVSHMENGRPPQGPARRLLEILARAADADEVERLLPEKLETRG